VHGALEAGREVTALVHSAHGADTPAWRCLRTARCTARPRVPVHDEHP